MKKIFKIIKILLFSVLFFAGSLIAMNYFLPETAAKILLSLERDRNHMKRAEAIIDVNETQVMMPYLVGGDKNKPAIVLVHGFGAGKENMLRLGKDLTTRYYVIMPDLPGFGEASKFPELDYGILAQVNHLHLFIEKLGLTKVALAGSSMGGHIVSEYAVQYPNQTTSLLLLGPGGTKAGFDSELRQIIAKTGKNNLISKTPEDFARASAFVMNKPPFMPSSIMKVMADQAVANHDLHEKIFNEFLNNPEKSPPLDSLIEERKVFDTPALLIWGKKDRALSYKGAETYKTLFPKTKVVLLEDIGHLPHLEDTNRVIAEYFAYRDALDSGK